MLRITIATTGNDGWLMDWAKIFLTDVRQLSQSAHYGILELFGPRKRLKSIVANKVIIMTCGHYNDHFWKKVINWSLFQSQNPSRSLFGYYFV